MVYKILFAELLGWKANIINALSYLLGFLDVVAIHYLMPDSSITFALVAFLSSLSIIVLQTDYIVMSQKLSAADIIKYTVTMKIFGLMFFIYTAVLQALWPVCAELRVKMQWRKLHRIIFLNIIGGVFFIGLGTLFIYVLKDYIYSIIANGIDYNISEVVFVLLAVYFSIRVWCDTFAMLLQSMNQLKILWLIVPCQALIGGVTQWYFAEHYGIVGILYGLILSFSLTVFWGLPVYYMYKSKRLA